jgi:RecA-family ATPase
MSQIAADGAKRKSGLSQEIEALFARARGDDPEWWLPDECRESARQFFERMPDGSVESYTIPRDDDYGDREAAQSVIDRYDLSHERQNEPTYPRITQAEYDALDSGPRVAKPDWLVDLLTGWRTKELLDPLCFVPDSENEQEGEAMDNILPFDKGRGKKVPNKAEAPSVLPYVDMSAWDNKQPPARQWLVDDLIPMRQPALLSGEGAVGKSILILQLLAATSLQKAKWLDCSVTHGPALYVGAEDENDELWRRLAAIAEHYKVKFSDLISGGFKMLGFAGQNAALATFDRSGQIVPTPMFERLYEDACALRPKCIAIDATSDVFIGNEIDRSQVRQFGAVIRKLAIDSGASVILAAHPSLSGINSGTGLSGSTQWHNTVRARAYFQKALKSEYDEPTEQPDNGLRILQFQKNQYGPLAASIPLMWKAGLWVPQEDIVIDTAATQKAERMFMDIMRRLTEQGLHFSDKKGPTYAPAKFAEQPEAKRARISTKAFADAVEMMLATGEIRVVTEGPASRRRSHIVEGTDETRGWKRVEKEDSN